VCTLGAGPIRALSRAQPPEGLARRPVQSIDRPLEWPRQHRGSSRAQRHHDDLPTAHARKPAPALVHTITQACVVSPVHGWPFQKNNLFGRYARARNPTPVTMPETSRAVVGAGRPWHRERPGQPRPRVRSRAHCPSLALKITVSRIRTADQGRPRRAEPRCRGGP